MGNADNNLYQFDNFRLDTTERSLWRGDELVPLPPKVLDVLFLLVEKNGGIVSKKELMDAVWADAFVEESNLTQNIYTLRRMLGKNEVGQDFIETVPRRGYRFAVPVNILASSDVIQEKAEQGNESLSSDFVLSGEKLLTEKKVPPPSRPFSFTTSVIGFGIVAVLVLLVGITQFYFFPTQVSRSSEAPTEKVSFQKLTFTGDISFPVIAPDGKSFAYIKDNSIFLQEIDSEKALRLNVADAKVFGFLQFSQDNNSIYFRNQASFELAGTVFQVSRFGGVAKMVAENVWSGFSFSPDGNQMAFVRFQPSQDEYALIVKNLDSGEERTLVTCKSPDLLVLESYPSWSADGKRLAAITRSTPQPPFLQIIVIDLSNGKVEKINTPRLIQIEQVVWTPDGENLIVSARENQKFYQLWRVKYPNGELQRITNDLSIYRNHSLSADGKKLLARQYSTFSHIWVTSSEKIENAEQITFGNQNRDGAYGLTWKPDGDIVYVSRIIGNWDLWQLRPGDGSRQRLTENAGVSNVAPAITPDGKYVFFCSNRSGSKHIWRMDSEGENPTQITFSEGETEVCPSVSPDGAWLYYIQKSPKSSAVWRKSLIDGKTENLTADKKVSPNNFISLSPDGKFLLFQNLTENAAAEADKQTFQLAVIATGENDKLRFFNLPSSSDRLADTMRWASDGKAFDYIENTPTGAKLWRQSLDEKTPPQLLLDLPKAYVFNFAWSADGKNLALARGQEQNDAMLLTDFYP